MLNLSDESTPTDVERKIGKLVALRGDLAALTGKDKGAEITGVVQAWKASAEKVVELSASLEKLAKADLDHRFDAKVKEGQAAGKLTPAMTEKLVPAFKLAGEAGLAQLTAFVDTMPVLVKTEIVEAGGGNSDSKINGSLVQLTQEEKDIAAQTGLEESFVLNEKKKSLGIQA